MDLPNRLPVLLPWLGILLLLAAKPNRCAQAWWIWVPLVLFSAVGLVWQTATGSLPSSDVSRFLEVVQALAFGVAAVWLLANRVRRSHRFLTFLLTALVLAGYAIFALVAGFSWEPPSAVVVGSSAGVLSMALTLTGWLCRGRYGWFRLTLRCIGMLLAAWLVILVPFALFLTIVSRGGPSVLQLLVALLVITGINFGSALPFLVLSFVSGFYRERLKRLLHLESQTQPPVMTPQPPTGATTGT